MTDKLQEDYREYADRIEPSGEFLERLTHTLQEEQERQQEAARQRALPKQQPIGVLSRIPFRTLTVAAALVLVVGVAAVGAINLRSGSKSGEEPSSGIESPLAEVGEVNVGLAQEFSQGFSVGAGDWHAQEIASEEIPKALARKLESECAELACNDENRFSVAAVRLDEAETGRLAERIAEAEVCASAPAGNCLYYMAIFSDGSVAKFQIYEDTFLVISGEETFYQIGK